MDPITAFGLGVNILTVVDFSARILSDASVIWSHGGLPTTGDIYLVSDDLKRCCLRLKAIRAAPLAAVNPITGQDSQALFRLADQAIAIATEIEGNLPRPEASVSAWKALRLALVSAWGERKLRDKLERLDSIRNEIQFHVLVSIKSTIDARGLEDNSRMKAFDEETQRLIRATLQGTDSIRIELDSRFASISEKLTDTRRQLERQHQEAMAMAERHNQQINTLRTTGHPFLSEEQESLRVSVVTQKILNALWFSRISDRFDDIEPAHKQTFEWIYSNPQGEDCREFSSCTFMEWVRGDNGIYWISGRAGSGKSTLMKFLAQDDRTNIALKAWAGDRPLVTGRYWFWSQAHDPLQKSLPGLLRALLYDIITQNSGYASLLFPDQVLRDKDWEDFPTPRELRRAFNRLVSAEHPPTCIALMIDGLDEYGAAEDEHLELARILKDAACSKHLKVAVSSRPELPFEVTFGGCDKLRLHELTRQDLKVYIADVVNDHWRADFLVGQSKNGQEEKARLVDCAVEKSEGIFVWLRLVAKALVEELGTCSSLAELQEILDIFPRGLENLFRHMFHRIPEQRRTRGAQIIQLVRCSADVSLLASPWAIEFSPPPPMTALCLSALQSDHSDIIKRGREPLGKVEYDEAIQRIDSLLRSHCAGLLELRPVSRDIMESFEGVSSVWEYRVATRPRHDDEMDARVGVVTSGDGRHFSPRDRGDPEVVFMHKSVSDFLGQPDTQRDLLCFGTGVDGFTPYLSLMRCLLFKIKICDLAGERLQEDPGHLSLPRWYRVRNQKLYGWRLIERVMRSAIFAELTCLTHTEDILDNLDQTMAAAFDQKGDHWSKSCLWGWRHPRDSQLARGGRFGDIMGSSMLNFAITNGLARYPCKKLSQLEPAEQKVTRSKLLFAACNPLVFSYPNNAILRPVLVRQLLGLGADPNFTFEVVDNRGQNLATSPWKEMLHTLRGLRVISLEGHKQIFEIVQDFLANGADPAAEITWNDGATRRTARRQIQRSFVDWFAAEYRANTFQAEFNIGPAFIAVDDLLDAAKLPGHISEQIPHPYDSLQPGHDTAYPGRGTYRTFPSADDMERIEERARQLFELLDCKSMGEAPKHWVFIHHRLLAKGSTLARRLMHLCNSKRLNN